MGKTVVDCSPLGNVATRQLRARGARYLVRWPTGAMRSSAGTQYLSIDSAIPESMDWSRERNAVVAKA